MARFNTTVHVSAISCSRDSFVDLVYQIAEACMLSDSPVDVKLKLPKEIVVSGTYEFDELRELIEIDSAKSITIGAGQYSSLRRISIYFRSGMIGFRSFTITGESREELDNLVKIVKREAHERRPWWWIFSAVGTRFAAISTGAMGILLVIFERYPTALTMLLISLPLTALSLLVPPFIIGERPPSKLKPVFMWLLSTVTSGLIGALASKWIGIL